MSIVRAPRPDSYFTVLRNDVVRDDRLSYRARGVLAAILSRPDDWRTNSTQLAEECPNGEGREAVRTALRELKAAGYLHQRKVQGEGGRWITESVVYDTPTEDGFPGVGSPGVGFLGAIERTETKKQNSSSRDARQEDPQHVDDDADGDAAPAPDWEAGQEAIRRIRDERRKRQRPPTVTSE